MKDFLIISTLAFNILTVCASNPNDFDKPGVKSGDLITWEQVSPGNAGFANLLRYHPTIPGKIILCPDMWNAYQSEDNGKTWYSITDSDGEGDFMHIRDLYYSAKYPDFAIASTSSLLWKSENGGKNWQKIKYCPWYVYKGDGYDKESWKKKISAVAIDPNDKDVWYVSGGSNVRGQEWLSCYKTINAKQRHGIEAQFQGKLWKTENAGRTWKLVNKGINEKAQIGRIIVHPHNSDIVFASSNYGIYKSDNGGKTWLNVGEGKLESNIIMDMDFYYNKETGKFILYVIDQTNYIPYGKTTRCEGGIYRTEDEGSSWIKMNGNLGLDLNRLSGGVPDSYYSYISEWLGIKPFEARKKFPQLPHCALQTFYMIAADPSMEGCVYIGFADPQIRNSIMPGRLWKTEDNGKLWINTARLYEETWEQDKAYWEERGNPWNENMNVGHASPHMRFGKNYALRSMRALSVGVDGSVMIVSDHSTMLSTDRGKTWNLVDEDYTETGAIIGHGNSNLPGLTIAQDLREETTLLGSGEHNLWIPEKPIECLPQKGNNLSNIPIRFINSTQPTVSCMVFDPYDVNTVYAISNRQEFKQYLFRSTDRGESWSKYGVATPATNKWLDDFYTNGFLIDPIDNNYLYFGITKIVDKNKGHLAGFYYSDNNGKTFTQSNSGLPNNARINDLKFDPRDMSKKSLFAAAQKSNFNQDLPLAEGGLYYSSDRGKTWNKVELPAQIQSVQFITFDYTNRMYITTGYRGGGAGVWYSDDFGKSWKQIFTHKGTECIEVSPFNRNYIAVSVRMLSHNPGVYISTDRGKTWVKSNKNIGIPHQIEDIKFDIFNPDEMWIATLGCGFYKGKFKETDNIKKVTVERRTLKLKIGESQSLNVISKQNVKWVSENESVAKVDGNGVVTAVGRGNVIIRAISEDYNYSDFCSVTIK